MVQIMAWCLMTSSSMRSSHYQNYFWFLYFLLQEYDYVFDVDIQEDKPPLKLPYNATDDPWMAAHKFLEDNDLSQMYLDQVVKFIQSQTKGVELGPKQLPVNCDPYTGRDWFTEGYDFNFNPVFVEYIKKHWYIHVFPYYIMSPDVMCQCRSWWTLVKLMSLFVALWHQTITWSSTCINLHSIRSWQETPQWLPSENPCVWCCTRDYIFRSKFTFLNRMD